MARVRVRDGATQYGLAVVLILGALAALLVIRSVQIGWPQQGVPQLAERERRVRPAAVTANWPRYQDEGWGYEVRYPPTHTAVPGEGHGQVVRWYQKGKPQLCAGGFACAADIELHVEGTALRTADLPLDVRGQLVTYFVKRSDTRSEDERRRETEAWFATAMPIRVNGVPGLLVETPDDPEVFSQAVLIQIQRDPTQAMLVNVQIAILAGYRRLADPQIFQRMLSTYRQL